MHTSLLTTDAGKSGNAEVPLADLESTRQSLGYESPDLGCPLRDFGADAQCRPVVQSAGAIVAAALMGFDGVAGWIHGLRVSHEHQKRGQGCAIILEAEKWLVSQGACIDLQARQTNLSGLGFCDRVGYRYDPVVLAKCVRSAGNQEEG